MRPHQPRDPRACARIASAQEIDFTGANPWSRSSATPARGSRRSSKRCASRSTPVRPGTKRSVKALVCVGPAQAARRRLLEFTSRRQGVEVHRSSPGGPGYYPPATHSLIGSHRWQPARRRRSREVNEHIVELVGPRYDAFLRAVLLPAGALPGIAPGHQQERAHVDSQGDLPPRRPRGPVREIARTPLRRAGATIRRYRAPAREAARRSGRRLPQHWPSASMRRRLAEQQRLKAATAAVRAATQAGSQSCSARRICWPRARARLAMRTTAPLALLGEE